MTSYFHMNTERFKKRMKYILLIALLPLLSGSVIALLVLFLNLRVFLLSGFAVYICLPVAAAVFLSVLLCRLVILKGNKAIKRNARYTFFDIGEQELVFSRYAGEYIRQGERIIFRRMEIIPLKSLSSVKISANGEKLLLISENAGIRSYIARSERLGYHFVGGKLTFDNWWYNDNCFKTRTEVIIPAIFGGNETLGRSITEAKKRFDSRPAKKPYVHKELDFVKRKKAVEALKRL